MIIRTLNGNVVLTPRSVLRKVVCVLVGTLAQEQYPNNNTSTRFMLNDDVPLCWQLEVKLPLVLTQYTYLCHFSDTANFTITLCNKMVPRSIAWKSNNKISITKLILNK